MRNKLLPLGLILLSLGLVAFHDPLLSAVDTSWPKGAAVSSEPAVFPVGYGVHKILIDPGHGAEGNVGNLSALCRQEQDFTVQLALDVARSLRQSGHFEVVLSRRPDMLVDYHDRVANAESQGAEAFISLHSDVRGSMQKWSPTPGVDCEHSHEAPGFSVLWSDDGSGVLRAKRRRLAGSIASEMSLMGLPAYGGEGYQDSYVGSLDVAPGVFLDRHDIGKRIFVLHKPTMPSIIIETHNARDEREAHHWETPEVRTAFANALMRALVTFFTI